MLCSVMNVNGTWRICSLWMTPRLTTTTIVVSAGMESVIPPRKNRKERRDYDKNLYKLRHLVENCFLFLKRWRGIATRYAKTSDAFIAAVHVRCIAIWAAIRA